MKKAYLVTFEVTTRVVADVPEDFDPNNCNFCNTPHALAFDGVVAEARKHIVEDAENYLYGDNISEFNPDDECPYGTFEGEE